ncbi:MAG: hypothetical protein U0531_21820 [Dehalococcoidia bacterium]
MNLDDLTRQLQLEANLSPEQAAHAAHLAREFFASQAPTPAESTPRVAGFFLQATGPDQLANDLNRFFHGA